jgi:putative acetyltransferase
MIRLTRPSDLEAVFSIYMDEGSVPYLGYDPMPMEAFRPIYSALVDSGEFHVLEKDGEVVAFCRATRNVGRARHGAYLGTFAVHPRDRGSGLAREFFETMIANLELEGVLRVELLVESDNPRALAFYRKLGFHHEGTLRAAYKRSEATTYVDELLLARLLGPLGRAAEG